MFGQILIMTVSIFVLFLIPIIGYHFKDDIDGHAEWPLGLWVVKVFANTVFISGVIGTMVGISLGFILTSLETLGLISNTAVFFVISLSIDLSIGFLFKFIYFKYIKPKLR